MNAAPATPPLQELPDWMKIAMRGTDWGALLIVGLCLALGLAIWRQSDGLPRTYWGDSTLFQAADVADALREGRLYPRWSPHALGGYGAPIAHFSPPAAPYLIGALSLLLGSDLVLAAQLVGIIALAMGGAAMYGFIVRRTDTATAFVSALLYAFSPTAGLLIPRTLGDFPLILALALWPALLWVLDRLWARQGASDTLLVALFTAALCLCDPRFAAFGVTIGLLDGLIQRRALSRALGAMALGLGLCAFYWLPAWLEASQVTWQASPLPPLPILAHWGDLFQLPQAVDPSALLQRPQFSLGWPTWALTLAALLIYRQLPAARRRSTLLYVGLALALTLSLPWWAQQQPWLMAGLALSLAINAAHLHTIREKLSPLWQRLSLAFLVLFILIANYAVWISPAPPPSTQVYTPLGQINYEIQGFGVATLPQGHPVPAAAAILPPTNAALLGGYRDQSIQRFSPLSVIANQASVLEVQSHRLRFQLRTTNYIETTLLLSYFDGWTAWLGDTALSLRPQANGLALLNIPRASDQELIISLESTPLRQLAWLISWACGLLLLGWTRSLQQRHVSRFVDLRLLTRAESRLLMTVVSTCIGLALLLTLAPLPINLRPEPGHGMQQAARLNSRTDQDIELIGYELDEQARLGDSLNVVFYWRVARPQRQPFAVRVNLQSVSTGANLLTTPPRPAAAYPLARWPRDLYVRDEYRLVLPPDLPPGRYIISVEWLLCTEICDESSRANFFDSTGRTLGRALSLPRIVNLQP